MAIRRLPSTGDAPRSTDVPASLVPGGSVDSAGFPWEGRTFEHHETGFADDSGLTPETYSEAVNRLRSAAANRDAEALAAATSEVLLALSQVRLLVPLVAEAGELGVTPSGAVVEKTQELSIVTVASPDGRAAMPVFTSVAAMQQWNPEARPIPVPGPQAALAAAQEGTDILIVDPGSAATEFGVRRTQLEAVARSLPVLPAWADSSVRAAFAESATVDSRILRIDVQPGDAEHRLQGPELEVVLVLRSGVLREELQSVLGVLQQIWSGSSVIAERVDSLRVLPRSSS